MCIYEDVIHAGHDAVRDGEYCWGTEEGREAITFHCACQLSSGLEGPHCGRRRRNACTTAPCTPKSDRNK